jgi:tetratricopeptide (TPR) repeat protein
MKPVEEERGRELYLRALKGRAETLDLVGRHSDSILDYTSVLENSKEVLDRIEARVGLHHVYDKIGEIDTAKKFATGALSDARKEKDDTMIGVSLTSLAFSLINRGEFDRARKKAKEAIGYLRKASKEKGLTREERRKIKGHLADAYNSIGHIENQQGRFSEALHSFERGLGFVEESDNQLGIVTLLNNIGWTYKLVNDHKKAVTFFSQAMEISQRIGSKNAIATIVGNLGMVYHDMAEYEKALSHFQKALDINREMGSVSGIGINMNNMGNVYLDKKEIDRARKLFLQSLDIFSRIGYHFGTAMVLSNLGIIYFGMGDYKKSLEFVKRSEVLVQKSSITEIGLRNRVLKGRILRETGKLQESLETLRDVIKDSENFGVMDIFINAVVAYVETVCAGRTIFPKEIYLSKAEPAILLDRAEKISRELNLKQFLKDIGSVREKWEGVVRG